MSKPTPPPAPDWFQSRGRQKPGRRLPDESVSEDSPRQTIILRESLPKQPSPDQHPPFEFGLKPIQADFEELRSWPKIVGWSLFLAGLGAVTSLYVSPSSSDIWDKLRLNVAFPVAGRVTEPDLAIVHKWLVEHLNDADYELVRTWGPLTCQRTYQKWVDTRLARDAEELAQARNNGWQDEVNRIITQQNSDLMELRDKGIPRLIRVRIRSRNGLGAKVLGDKVYWVRDGKVFAAEDPDEMLPLLAKEDAAVLDAY